MVLLLVVSTLAVLATSWARSAGPGAVAALDRFSNAAGLLNRIVRVVDGIRDLAVWLSPMFSGGAGRGPLAGVRDVPAPRPGGNPALARHSTGVSITDMTVLEDTPA